VPVRSQGYTTFACTTVHTVASLAIALVVDFFVITTVIATYPVPRTCRVHLGRFSRFRVLFSRMCDSESRTPPLSQYSDRSAFSLAFCSTFSCTSIAFRSITPYGAVHFHALDRHSVDRSLWSCDRLVVNHSITELCTFMHLYTSSIV